MGLRIFPIGERRHVVDNQNNQGRRGSPNSFTDPSHRANDLHQDPRGGMRDDETTRARLEQLRGQLLTKDELRGWIRALQWVLGT
jgi:hypothetical protein